MCTCWNLFVIKSHNIVPSVRITCMDTKTANQINDLFKKIPAAGITVCQQRDSQLQEKQGILEHFDQTKS